MLYLKFIISAAVIVVAGIKLTIYADILSNRLGLGKVWIGVILLGFVTSMPEAVASLAAVISLGANDLAVGNITGSINFNIILIVLMDLLFREGSVTNKIKYNRSNLMPVNFAVLLTGIIIAEILLGAKTDIPTFLGISYGSLLILILYVVGIKEIKRSSVNLNILKGIKNASQLSLGKIYTILFMSAFFVVAGALLLTRAADAIAVSTGLGRTFIGTTLLAFVTSLPEMVVTISALKIGSFDMAMGNIFGSNMTNIFIIFLCDVFYRKGALLATVSKTHLIPAVLSIFLTSIAVLGIKDKEKGAILGLGWDSWFLAIFFTGGMSLLYFIK